METPRYTNLLAAFRSAIDGIDRFDEDVAAGQLAKRALRKLRRAAAIPADAADEELHKLRIRAKRARYAAELAALGGGKAPARSVEAFKKLQDVIGEHQDAVVAEAKLRSVATAGSAVAAGRLIEREHARRTARRSEYRDAVETALKRGGKAFG